MIGLSGKRGAGKGTVAAFLSELFPSAYDVVSFADPLKEIAAKLTGQPLSLFHSQAGKATFLPEWNLTAGEFLQKLGNGTRETLHDEVWIKASFASLNLEKKHIHESVRYPNEADVIRAYGGQVWRVEGDPLSQRGDGTRDDTHASETALDYYPHFDVTLYNRGTRAELYAQIRYHLGFIDQPQRQLIFHV